RGITLYLFMKLRLIQGQDLCSFFCHYRSRPGESIDERHFAKIISRPESTEQPFVPLTPPLYYVDSATNNNEETTVVVSFRYDFFPLIKGMMTNTFGKTHQLFSFQSREEWDHS